MSLDCAKDRRIRKLKAENAELRKRLADGPKFPPYFDSEIFDAWEEEAEQRRKRSRDPHWTPGDIV